MTPTTSITDLSGDYTLDTARTRIGFVARHTMATKVAGQFDEFEGGAHLDSAHPSKSGARLTIRAKSIRTRNRQRDRLLLVKFLDADNHPAITFVSTGVEQTDATGFKVTGDLTIRGVTGQVTVDVELTGGGAGPGGGFRAVFKGSVTINRNDWHVNWNPVTAVMISPMVTLEFDATAIRQP